MTMLQSNSSAQLYHTAALLCIQPQLLQLLAPQILSIQLNIFLSVGIEHATNAIVAPLFVIFLIIIVVELLNPSAIASGSLQGAALSLPPLMESTSVGIHNVQPRFKQISQRAPFSNPLCRIA